MGDGDGTVPSIGYSLEGRANGAGDRPFGVSTGANRGPRPCGLPVSGFRTRPSPSPLTFFQEIEVTFPQLSTPHSESHRTPAPRSSPPRAGCSG